MKEAFISIILTAVLFFIILTIESTKFASSDNLSSIDIPTIIIDAGHGGEDGGAIADDNTLEKDINLEISAKLNDLLSAFGYQTKMIRITDTDLHLEGNTIRQRKISDIQERYKIMNSFKDCFYISIHQNKFSDSKVHGAQTFYSPNNNESKILAGFIQKSIASQLQPDNKRAIKKSGTDIYLLYNATRPTVMVECGFISNRDELSNLKDNDYQKQMALSIAFGIINYNISEVRYGSEV